MVFMQLEVRQRVGPGPGGVAAQSCPVVVVARLAAHVNHAVDAGRAAQRFAARVAQAAAIQTRLRFGVVQPVGARVANAVQVTDGDVNPVVVVFAPRFNHQHSPGGISTQPVGQQATGRAAAHNDVVKNRFAGWSVVLHGFLSQTDKHFARATQHLTDRQHCRTKPRLRARAGLQMVSPVTMAKTCFLHPDVATTCRFCRFHADLNAPH